MCMSSRPHLPQHQLMMISYCFPSITHLARVVVEIRLQLPHILAKSPFLTLSGQQDPRTPLMHLFAPPSSIFIIFILLSYADWISLSACADGFCFPCLMYNNDNAIDNLQFLPRFKLPPMWDISATATSIFLYWKPGNEIGYSLREFLLSLSLIVRFH